MTLPDGTRSPASRRGARRYRPSEDQLAALSPEQRASDRARAAASAARTLYRIGNYDLYGEDFRWVSEFEIARGETPRRPLLLRADRVGTVHRARRAARDSAARRSRARRSRATRAARRRTRAPRALGEIRRLEHEEIGDVNRARWSASVWRPRASSSRYGAGSAEHRARRGRGGRARSRRSSASTRRSRHAPPRSRASDGANLVDARGRRRPREGAPALARHALLRRQRPRRSRGKLGVYVVALGRVPDRGAARGEHRRRRPAGDLRHRRDDAPHGRSPSRRSASSRRSTCASTPARAGSSRSCASRSTTSPACPRSSTASSASASSPTRRRRASTSSSSPSGCRARRSAPAGCCGRRSRSRCSPCRS